MPAPLDLTNKRFGRLTVMGQAGRLKFGVDMPAWRCRCDCGTEVTVPRLRLTRGAVNACQACRLGRPCVICGANFIPASSRAITCSATCRALRRNSTLASARKARDEADPDAVAARHRRHRARIKADPIRLRQAREKKAAWYAANRERINAHRRAARATEGEDDRSQRLAATRRYIRLWLVTIRADPDRYADYLSKSADARRRMRLAALARLGAKMVDKL